MSEASRASGVRVGARTHGKRPERGARSSGRQPELGPRSRWSQRHRGAWSHKPMGSMGHGAVGGDRSARQGATTTCSLPVGRSDRMAMK
jgi:hypothetical protein